LATGELSPAVLEAMHERLRREAGVDAVYVCPHDDAHGCVCRKPRPGLLLQAAREWGVDVARSFMVGDRYRDVEAGRAAGCVTILVAGPEAGPARPDHRAADLREAVATILTLTRGES
jgi:D-glycero-D-manno-heptose 1,7-bisphosphate phosphatase